MIASLGISPTQIAATAATAAIPGEVKRIAGVAGQVVADDQFYISAGDQTEDTYTVRTIGLYLNTGVLFGVYSQAAPLLEKAAPAMAVLEAAIKLSSPQANAITFTGGGWLNPQASETVQGVLKLAPVDEVVLGADHSKAVTPKGLKAATLAMMAAIQATFDQVAQALAGKANTLHQHAAGDVTSGTFSEARIPALPQNRITGLIDALTGKAAALHGHVMADIDGLAQALSGKSAVGHKHDASDTNSGVFDVARIPALAMEKVTGLSNALAAKLTSADFIWGKLGNKPDYFPTNRVAASDPNVGLGGIWIADDNRLWVAHSGSAHGVWDTSNFGPQTKATLGDSVTFADIRAFRGNGTGVVYLGDLSHYVYFDSANYNMPGAPLIVNGGVVWTSATFDPNSRVPMTRAHNSNPDDAPIGVSSGDANIGQGTQGWHYFTSRRAGSGWGVQTAITDTDTSEQFKFRRSDNNGAWGPWRTVWTTVNFNPASKVDVFNPDGYAHAISLGWNGSRMVARVDGAVAAPGQALVHLNDAASPTATAAGAATDQFITPAALWSFARNMGSPGYAVIPGTGLMIQWGLTTANIPEGETHASLPVAFGGGCLVALANPRNVSRNINTDYYMQVAGHFIDRIAFFANRANGSAGNLDGFEWLAIGRVSGTPDPAYSSGGSGGTGGGGGSGSGGGGAGGGGGDEQQQI
ncbi:MAG: hypothetical protein P0Y50_08975 [Candidatus Brevundimonas colombiensis]|uniref:Putative tail fiber protein gp53-like C-terminal domain-containing protein n=1 Tax=Candidatus Brevundimonas colombiensis TaxID=3121376 RepID=A0AAJ5X1Y8_9CAUL|nr:hypothetical protein [Brevundimonas sp.]WEK38685.1 MAG: hypothetical protein P0Y50_08975 [Brevundimonas sp.]